MTPQEYWNMERGDWVKCGDQMAQVIGFNGQRPVIYFEGVKPDFEVQITDLDYMGKMQA